MSIVTLDDAKKQINIPADATEFDDEVQAYCDGITAVIEDYKREVIEPRTIREDIEHAGRSGRCFRLWSVPVISLTSLTSVTGSTVWDVSPTVLRVNSNTGLVRVLSGPAVRGLAEAVYQAGYQTIPDNYRRGALVALQHNWETRRGAAGGGVRNGVVGPEEVYDPRWSYSIPRKALEWLGAPRPVVG
ncbi:hypothetical protein RVR_5821 [Actinacidiphila reveromycinica]|uniref:Uncharacterized protein n=1 Tax=Actinacidiphila reveromycinica TaxID=659352 RepID=A0A7U3VQ50_9ACTN|nr:hypothetical protein [Streptomyces sp. SN-593]BBA99274.1 hypothetical protein RVR_5821 [Streptomyces sp. SN-593]